MSACTKSVHIFPALSKPAGKARRRWCVVAMLASAAAGLAACGKEKPVHYFQLTHPPTTALSASQSPIDAIVMVRLFQTSHLYREDRIVYGNDTVEVGLYDTDRWTEPPVDLLRDALARGLRSSNQFRAVTSLRSEMNFDYYLAGQLYAFREVDGNGGLRARLNFDVELIDVKKSKTIWRHTYNHDETSSGDGVAALAEAMNKNVHQAVQEIQDGIVQAISEYTRK
jgi:ABC-type uncharacterized transport system auxiliary subunit